MNSRFLEWRDMSINSIIIDERCLRKGEPGDSVGIVFPRMYYVDGRHGL